MKARPFVLALREYYRQRSEEKRGTVRDAQPTEEQSNAPLPPDDEDDWALEWISVTRLQAIAEAFDDDGSGFITTAEVNNLTSSRPSNWRRVANISYRSLRPS